MPSTILNTMRQNVLHCICGAFLEDAQVLIVAPSLDQRKRGAVAYWI